MLCAANPSRLSDYGYRNERGSDRGQHERTIRETARRGKTGRRGAVSNARSPAPFDIVSGAFVVGGLITETQNDSNASSLGSALLVSGILSYALGPPIVHLVRGNPGKGAIDLAMRVTGPLMAAALGGVLALGVASGPCSQNNTCMVDTAAYAAAGGLAIGYVTTLMVDYLVLANDPARPVAAHPVARPTAWSPYATPVPSGATIGVAGVF